MSWWRPWPSNRSPMLGAIRFDTNGWKSVKTEDEGLQWRDRLGNTLRLRFHSRPAEQLAELRDLESVRSLCRRNAEAAGGAIVSVDIVNVAGIPCLKVIDKYERRPAYDYAGTLTIPLRDSHYEIVMNATEHGTTGVREAMVFAQLAAIGEVDLSAFTAGERKSGPIPGWFKDPYDPGYQGRVLRCQSDDERLDALLPDHPLSRIRFSFAKIQPSIELDPVSEQAFHIEGDAAEEPAVAPMSSAAVAMLYVHANQYEQAENVLLRSLGQHGSDPAADPLRVARESLVLGVACEQQGKLADAETAFRRASASFEVSEGANHPDTAQATVNVARILIARGEHGEAEPLLRRALQVLETVGDSGSVAAVALNGLGLIYNAHERYYDAIPCFERAIEIFERVHGPTFPDVATALRNMSFSWKQLGNLERMAEARDRADDIDSRRPS
jgi:tetratricopeptide (TPR) repeat protein